MSTHDPNNSNGQSLDKMLEDVERTYTGLVQEQPPELLDQAILNKARREIKARPRWMQFGWPHAVSTAAVFVLAFGLVLNQRENAPVEQEFEQESAIRYMRDLPPSEDTDQFLTPEPSVERRSLQKAAEAPLREAPTLKVTAPIASEDVLLEEADFMAVLAPMAADVAEPEVVGASTDASRKEEDRVLQDAGDVEQQLLEIMRLKMVGDEAWRAALDAFLEKYPDYPLPHELRG